MPTEENVTRKLRAILSADVKGYSLLMSDDEAFTVRTLKSYRKVMSSQIVRHKGRVVDAPGDNLLAEFASVVDAVQCAVEIQKILKGRNENLPELKRLKFRIGVNIGDVIQDGDSLYGEGVNIAARIEGLADAGGVCISRNAYDHVKNKLTLGYEYIGEQAVKNIKDPVRVYKVLMAPEDAGKLIGDVPKSVVKNWVWATIVLAAVAITSVGWLVYQNSSKPEFEPATIDKMAFPLPDKPSIAVLAFDNLSGDPDQEFFSDGLTEEIIAGLSKIPSLFVIARNSSFTYKGKPVNVKQVSEELGVRYVLEGSVRKEKDRVRITAQLIDAISGYHKWSKRYDRKMGDIFILTDEIMRDLINEMQVQLIEGERARVWHQEFLGKKINLVAYEKHMQSRWHFFQMNPEGFAISERLAEEAIEIEPNYYAPYVMLAFLNRRNPPIAFKYAQKALELNDSAPMALITVGQIYLDKRQWDKALAMGERALALDPNSAEVKNHLGSFQFMAGNFEESVLLLERALRLNPYPPSFYYYRLGATYFALERYDEAVDVCRIGLKRNPRDVIARIVLAIAYIGQGYKEEAHAEAKKVIKAYPTFSIRQYKATSPQKNELVLNRIVEAMGKAGLPD